MPTSKLRPGVGAQFWVQTHKAHPKRHIARRYPNYDKRIDKMEGCLMLREGMAKTSNEMRAVFFSVMMTYLTENSKPANATATLQKKALSQTCLRLLRK